MLKLNQINTLPEGLLELGSPTELHTLLPEPTLLQLEGRRKKPLFVSILLHGNEDTGFFAIQKLLAKYQQMELPRSLSIFFGNVVAAKENARRLDGQPDYNRVWPGGDTPACPETRLMAELTAVMAARSPFASIDVHNNTGLNPHYGCINKLDHSFLQLASLFSRTVVFFENPTGVQSMAMAEYCPAVTLECGKSHMPHGAEHALEYLDSVLNMAEIPDHPVPEHDIDVFHTVARVSIPKNRSFSFSDPSADIQLSKEIEGYNFSELPVGTTLAHTSGGNGSTAILEGWNDHHENRAEEFFRVTENRIELAQALMPAMLTLDEKVIRQDCLCYLMERIQVRGLAT